MSAGYSKCIRTHRAARHREGASDPSLSGACDIQGSRNSCLHVMIAKRQQRSGGGAWGEARSLADVRGMVVGLQLTYFRMAESAHTSFTAEHARTVLRSQSTARGWTCHMENQLHE